MAETQTQPPIIGLFGSFQDGKSLLINCMLGRTIAPSGGMGVSTTGKNTLYQYGDEVAVTGLADDNSSTQIPIRLDDFMANRLPAGLYAVVVSVPAPILKTIRILDTPGVNAKGDESAEAYRALRVVDAAIVVTVNHGLAEFQTRLMREIELRAIPYVVVMNCFRRLSPASWHPRSEFNASIMQKNAEQLKSEGFTPLTVDGHEAIMPVNALWHWYACGLYRGVELTEPMTMGLEDARTYASAREIKREECGVDELCRYVTSARFLATARIRIALKAATAELLRRSENYRRDAIRETDCLRAETIDRIEREIRRLEMVCDNMRKDASRLCKEIDELGQRMYLDRNFLMRLMAMASHMTEYRKLEFKHQEIAGRIGTVEWKIKSWNKIKNQL